MAASVSAMAAYRAYSQPATSPCVEQQAATRLTPEQGLHLRSELGILRVGLRRHTHLGADPSSSYLLQIHVNEVVCVDPGLVAGGQLLPGVAVHFGYVRCGQSLEGGTNPQTQRSVQIESLLRQPTG